MTGSVTVVTCEWNVRYRSSSGPESGDGWSGMQPLKLTRVLLRFAYGSGDREAEKGTAGTIRYVLSIVYGDARDLYDSVLSKAGKIAVPEDGVLAVNGETVHNVFGESAVLGFCKCSVSP